MIRDYLKMMRCPSTPSSLQTTHVRDPRATERFNLDDRVWWDEGDGKKLTGTVVGFGEDECIAKVRLDLDHSLVHWPTLSSRMKRIQNHAFDEQTMADGLYQERLHDTMKNIERVTDETIATEKWNRKNLNR